MDSHLPNFVIAVVMQMWSQVVDLTSIQFPLYPEMLESLIEVPGTTEDFWAAMAKWTPRDSLLVESRRGRIPPNGLTSSYEPVVRNVAGYYQIICNI